MYRPSNGAAIVSATMSTPNWTLACQLIRSAPGRSGRAAGRRAPARRAPTRSSCRTRRRSCRQLLDVVEFRRLIVDARAAHLVGTDDDVAPPHVEHADREERERDRDEDDVSHVDTFLCSH